MKCSLKHRLLLVVSSLLIFTSLSSCVVEVIALAAIAKDLNNENPELPPLTMHEGSKGNYPIAKAIDDSSTLVSNPYTNKPVNIYGKPAGALIRSPGLSNKKFYIPKLSQFPTAKKIANKPGAYTNPYDSKEITMGQYKPGSLVASPTVGTFFYLED